MKRKILMAAGSAIVVAALVLTACASPSVSPTPTQTSKPATTAPGTTAPVASTSPTTKPTTTAPAPTQQQVIKWNMQSTYPTTSANTLYFGTEWVEWVKKITNGRLQIELHPPGTFASGTDVLAAVGKGTIQGALDYSGYYSQSFPISNVESGLPLAWYNFTDVYDAFYNRGLMQLVREEYGEKNVFNLAISVPGGGYHFGTKFPLNSLADIAGKKIRATGVYADYVKALGGSPTVVAATEMYMALKTGMIDGMIFGMSTLESYKLAEVIAEYVETPPIGLMVSAGHYFNVDAWKSLPEDIRTLLEAETINFFAMANTKYEIYSRKSKIWAMQNYKVKFVTLSAADEAKAWATVMPIWDKISNLSPRNAKAVEIVKQQARDYGRIK